MGGRQPSLTKRVEEHPRKAEAEPVLKDVETYAALDAIANQEGGRILIEGLTEDILDAIESITGLYKKATHGELQGYAAQLAARLGVLRTLKHAEKNKILAREALKEIIGT